MLPLTVYNIPEDIIMFLMTTCKVVNSSSEEEPRDLNGTGIDYHQTDNTKTVTGIYVDIYQYQMVYYLPGVDQV